MHCSRLVLTHNWRLDRIKPDLKEILDIGKETIETEKNNLFCVFLFIMKICFCSSLCIVGIQNMTILFLWLLSLNSLSSLYFILGCIF